MGRTKRLWEESRRVVNATPDESGQHKEGPMAGARWVKTFEIEGAQVTHEGTKVTIVLDLSEDIGESSTGASLMVATSHGNQKVAIPGEVVYLSLNVYKFEQQVRSRVDYRDIDGSVRP